MAAGEFGKAFWGGAGGAAPGALLGLATMPFRLMEAGRQREFQRSAMEAQLQAANYATQQSAANQLMGLQAQLGENLGARVFGSTVAPDLEQGRQRIARLEQENIIRPKEIASSYDVAKREQDLANSPAAKESLYQNLLNYKRQRGLDAALPGELAFGRTAFSGRFTA
jgi:hypothetical protein